MAMICIGSALALSTFGSISTLQRNGSSGFSLWSADLVLWVFGVRVVVDKGAFALFCSQKCTYLLAVDWVYHKTNKCMVQIVEMLSF